MYLAHQSVETYYETMFIMAQDYKWSISEIEGLIPWERDIYVLLLANWVKRKNENKTQT